MADGRFVALALRPDALVEDCSRAAVVVTTRAVAEDCAAIAITRDRLDKQGALALFGKGNGFDVGAVRRNGAIRPWSPAHAGEGEFETSLAPRPASSRGRDATPAEADQQAEE